MTKECPSCGENYYILRKCKNCGHEFCNKCQDHKFIVVAIVAACPKCSSDYFEVISADEDDREESEDSSQSDNDSDSGGVSSSDYDSSPSYSSSESSSSSSDYSSTSNPQSFWSILMFTLISAGIWFVVSYVIAGILGFFFPIWRIILFRILLSNWFVGVSDDTLAQRVDLILHVIVYGGCVVILVIGIFRCMKLK